MMKTVIGFVGCLSLFVSAVAAAQPQARPNILWITSEDNGPHLGAYGDSFADTPNLDGLAARGVRYLNAWSNAPVCAPARTAIITGVYPPSTGAEHMRSMLRLPSHMRMFPQFLREAGYYCTNNSKEDYNLEKPGQVWDVSSKTGHWRDRRPGQPFFAVFNLMTTHESKIRQRPHTPVHDPAKVCIPSYHPDMPEVRLDWGQYYDKMTEMDAQVGAILGQLAADGLVDDTIVFYYGDHGPGMPRSKRWPYNSGLRVPLLVSVPERFKHLVSPDYTTGESSDRLVGFVDLAPTVLSLVGIRPPAYMQGHAFMGQYQMPEQPYAYGFRGRMDERYDMVRSVRDKRYLYIRNYMPHEIYGQHVAYMFQTPTTRVWKELYDRGELAPPKTFFWQTKPAEELYDLVNDPDEVSNLIESPEHQAIAARLREEQKKLAIAIRDVGFLPEDEIHTRSRGSSPYEMGHDPQRYPMERMMASAELASLIDKDAEAELVSMLRDKDSAVRYWGAMGILMRGADAVNKAAPALRSALTDPSPSVRIIAARALGQYGSDDDAAKVVPLLLELARLDRHSLYISMLALNALDVLDDKAMGAIETIKKLPTKDPSVHSRMRSNVPKLLEKILADLEGPTG